MGAGPWRIKACWLGAPASLLLCPSTANPVSCPRQVGAAAWTWTLAPPPSHLPARWKAWCLDLPQEGKRGQKGRGVGGSWKSRTCFSWAPSWAPPGTCQEQGPGWTEGPVFRVYPALPRLALPWPHSHLGGLYLFYSSGSATSGVKGWALGLY